MRDRNCPGRVCRYHLPAILSVLAIATLFATPAAAQSTYSYTGNTYDTVQGAYTTSMNITGSFAIPSQLTPNMPPGTDISGQVLSYGFSDGVQTLTEANSYIVAFFVETNSFCEITEYSITVWQGDSSVSGVTIAYSTSPPDRSSDFGFQGVPCATTDGGRCIADGISVLDGTDYGVLEMFPGTPGSWTGPGCRQQAAAPIPTLDHWGLALFAVAMASAAGWILARRRLV